MGIVRKFQPDDFVLGIRKRNSAAIPMWAIASRGYMTGLTAINSSHKRKITKTVHTPYLIKPAETKKLKKGFLISKKRIEAKRITKRGQSITKSQSQAGVRKSCDW